MVGCGDNLKPTLHELESGWGAVPHQIHSFLMSSQDPTAVREYTGLSVFVLF